MFRASQDIHLNNGSFATNVSSRFISSELTDISKVQIFNFPTEPVRTNSDVSFLIKRNGIRGNFEIMHESPLGNFSIISPEIEDSERLGIHIYPTQEGVHKVHIKCNSVSLPRSPFVIIAQNLERSSTSLPMFHSDASRVMCRGSGLDRIILGKQNEFIVDASNAGNNILFVGVCGPKGQCDEVFIKHMGRNIYNVRYQVQDSGIYIIAIKWGDDHIPGSPFQYVAT